MKLLSSALAFAICFLHVLTIRCQTCEERRDLAGVVSYSGSNAKCWIIYVPENSYLRMNVTDMYFNNGCTYSYLNITVLGTKEEYKLCSNSGNQNFVFLSDVSVAIRPPNWQYSARFNFRYHIESLICGKNNHFRCSDHICIHQYQVCDGKRDCEDGSDEIGCETGVKAVKGVNTSLEHSISWLKSQRDPSFGWGKNTPRAITALYLSGNVSFQGRYVEQELMAKELELQMSVALLRNSTDHLSVNELSMLVNALTATCFDTRRFFGNDLLQILYNRLSSESEFPGPYITLCNSNWTINENVTKQLLHLLQKESIYPFSTDVEAMTVMALTCIKERTSHFAKISNASEVYNATVKRFIDNQNLDGSFGNPQTTAWVTQALIAGGQENNKNWKLNATINYLMQQLNSSDNFLLTYLSLPILNSKSLLDISKVNCSGSYRKHRDEMDDLTHKLKGNLQIQYSLFIGDKKNVIHTMYFRIQEGSSAYDVMKIAQLTDKKYSFMSKRVSGYQYIYEVAGIPNDPEAGMFWLLYTKSESSNETEHISLSPDEVIIENGDHLIMWYKTSHI